MNSRQISSVLVAVLLLACTQKASAQVELTASPHAGYTIAPFGLYNGGGLLTGGSMYLDAGLPLDAGITVDYSAIGVPADIRRVISKDVRRLFSLTFLLKRDLAPEHWRVQPYLGGGVSAMAPLGSDYTRASTRLMVGIRLRTGRFQPFIQGESSFRDSPEPRLLYAKGGLLIRLL